MSLGLGFVLSSLLTLSSLAAPVVAPAPAPFQVGAENGFVMNVRVEGHWLRLRVQPNVGGIELNARAAAAIGLGTSGQRLPALIGPVRVEARARNGQVMIGNWRGRVPLRWFDREIVAGVDGIIGISALPFPVTIMHLRPPRDGQRPLSYAVEEHECNGLVHDQVIAGKAMKIVFSLTRGETIGTAATGAHLAAHFGGSWDGEAIMAPVGLGVLRPLRPMRLASPVNLGELSFDTLQVRTGDFRGAYALPQDASTDPSETVVTGRIARSRPSFTLSIGADRLTHCSSLRYDRAERRLTLTCDP